MQKSDIEFLNHTYNYVASTAADNSQVAGIGYGVRYAINIVLERMQQEAYLHTKQT